VLKVQCQLCQAPKSTEYKWCGSTSSMLRHLKEQHGHFKEDDEEDIEENQEDWLKRFQNNKIKRFERINRALLIFLVGCALSFNLVTHPLFKGLIETLDSTYQPPSAFILSNNYLDQEYEKVMSAIKMEFSKTESVSVTLDPWTSCQTYPYLGKC